MAIYTQEIATEYNFPNITVYRKLSDGEHYAWSIRANEGYVMYDTRSNDFEINPETMEQIPVTYYYTESSAPLRFDFTNFPWVAVPREDVDENYIFGGGNDNDHEVM